MQKLYFERRECGFSSAEAILGKDTTDALRELYELYDEKMYELFASLWDGMRGAFYFSESARDCDEFLPDIESTVQALRFMESSGLMERYDNSYSKGLPKRMRDSVISFARSLQSAEDGYFYHPQWGKDITTSRRGRDLGWATGLLYDFGESPLYDAPNGVKGTLGAPRALRPDTEDKVESVLPEYLTDVKVFFEYLDSLNLREKSYSGGNTLSAQRAQIGAAGNEFVDALFEYLNSHQYAENGLWQPETHYNSVNGLMKIQMIYTYFKRPIPNVEAALENSIRAVTSDEDPTGITSVYNPWVCISSLLSNIKIFVGEEKYFTLLSRLREASAGMIRATTKKLRPYKREDGGFSYNKVFKPKDTQNVSQGAPVARGDVFESSVNGTCLGATGAARNIFDALSVQRVPFYSDRDLDLFLEIAGEVR